MKKKYLLLFLTAIATPLCIRSVNDYHRFRLACDLRQRADQFDHEGQSQQALFVLQQARAAYPDFLDIYQEMAEIHIERNEWQQAYAAVNEAVSRCPNNPTSLAVVYRQRGFCLARWGKLPEAALDLRKALDYDPEECLTRRLLERVEAAQKDNDCSLSNTRG